MKVGNMGGSLEFPIRLESESGEYKKVVNASGKPVAEFSGGFEESAALVVAANAYPRMVELLRKAIAGEAIAPEAAKFLAYLGESA